MKYHVVEVGYKIVKIGKRAASCALSSLAGQKAFLSGGVSTAALIVAGALAANVAHAEPSPALTGSLSGDINGQLGRGFLITGDSRFGGSPNIIIGSTESQSLFYNFDTRGGAGAGGGAGLGGVFFVDRGATLTVRNTNFVSNRVQGGQGGSEPALRFYDQLYNITGQTVELPALLATAQLTGLTYDGNGYSFTSLQATADMARLLKAGSLVAFDNYGTTGNLRTVTQSGLVQFQDSIRIANDHVTALPTNAVTFASREMSINATYTEYWDHSTLMRSYTVPDLTGLTIGSSIVARSGSVATQLAEITAIEFWSQEEDDAVRAGGTLQGKVKSVSLSNAVTLPSLTNLDIIEAPNFNSAQFFTSTVNQDQFLTPTNPIARFTQGMVVTYLDPVDGETVRTAEIAEVRSDGSFRLNSPLPDGVLEFEAVETPFLGPNQIRVSDASSKFSNGQLIYVPGEDGSTVFSGTVQSIDGDVVTVTPLSGGNLVDSYEPSAGMPIKTSSASVGSGGSTITVRFDTSSSTPDQIAALFNGRTIEGESFGEDGTSITGVQVGNGTVTLSLGTPVDVNASIDYFKVLSPLAIGGSMNSLTAPRNTTGEDGGNGFSANWFSTFFAEGEGVDGTNGGPAREGDVGTGFNGGDGGNGSSGHPVNFFIAYDLTASLFGLKSATLDLKVALLEMADAPVPEPVVGAAAALPKPTELVKAIANLTKSKIDLAFVITDVALATANVIYWGIQLSDGLAGLGGAGGDGGEASGGADFFGGGKGGAGGDGGAGALSHTDGGDGGSGGRGGDGGFGAGGGMGGAGGEAGANGNAAGGDPGDGGYAGFGAGDGANGNGMFGGGGSGLGGAIFVREGGRLLITGNALFELNYVAGGTTTSQFGEAGIGVGSDIFLMKGASVELAPGLGNEIRFEGDIADDSLATNDGFMNAAGDGADIVISGGSGSAGGVVVFNGANTYSGHTILQGATLTAEVGVGINDSSLVRFNGAGSSNVTQAGTLSLGTVGTFLLQHDYVRRAGMDPFETAWTGSGGFASGMDAEAVVTLGRLDGGGERGQQLKWGFDGFFVTSANNGSGSNGALTFGSEQATSSVRFTNNVDLNGFGLNPQSGIGRVAVYRNTNQNGTVFETSNATLSGNWTNGGLLIGDAAPNSAFVGTLFMTGSNQLSNLLLAGGRLSTYGGSANTRLMAGNGDIIVNAGSVLDTFGTENARSVTVQGGSSLNGIWTIAGATSTSLDVVNEGAIYLLGSRDTHIDNAANALTALARQIGMNYIDGDTVDWRGNLNVGRNIFNLAGAEMWQAGVVNVTGNAVNYGTWVANGSMNVGHELANAGNMNFNAGTTGVVDVDGSFVNSGNWVQAGAVNVLNGMNNFGDWRQTGNTVVGGSLVNAGSSASDRAMMRQTGNLDIGGYLLNNHYAGLSQAGDFVVASFVANDGMWNIQEDSSISANTLIGSGSFLLAALNDTVDGPEVGDASTLTVTVADDSFFDGTFEGAGDLVKRGLGQIRLVANQLFSGQLTVDAGAIVADATMNDGLDIVVNGSGSYTANFADVVNTVRNDGSMTLNADFTTIGSFYNGSPNTLYLNADLSTINADVDNSGRIVVSGHRVMDIGTGTGDGPVASAGLTGSSAGLIQIRDGSSLTVVQHGDTTYNGVIHVVNVDNQAPASFVKDGTGALTLTGIIDVLDIDIARGDLRLDGANLLNASAAVNVRNVGALTLVSGDQSIRQLTGFGNVNLGSNRLIIANGGDFYGNISGSGTVDVESGDFNVSGELNSTDALFEVQHGSTTTVSSGGVLNVDRLLVDGSMFLQVGPNGMAHITGAQATITGWLGGTGMISAPTIIHNGGLLEPGASPGHLFFDDLTLASGSTTTMELYGVGDDDQVTVNAGGNFTIEGTAAFVLDTDYQPALGAVNRIFHFDTGSINGFFANASAVGTAPADRVVLNLATGSIVGLGGRTLDQLQALPTTENQQAMLVGLQVNEAGGLAQFYGGRFVENLTQAWANNADLDAVFERASPEVYAGIGSMAQSAAINAITKWAHSFVGEAGRQGTFVDIGSTNFSADSNGGTQMAFGTRTTNATVGFGSAVTDNTSLVFSMGTASTRLDGEYMSADGQGMATGLALVGRMPGSEGLYWNAGVRHAGISVDGTRITNNGRVNFTDVDGEATQFNVGLEYHQVSGSRNFGVRGNFVFGHSISDAFHENAGNENPLDAMSVHSVNEDYGRFEFGMKLGTEVTSTTRVFGSLDASASLNDRPYAVAASYDGGQGAFSVNALGLDAANVSASIGIDRDILETGRLSLSVGANNDWEGDTKLNASISARFDF